MLRPDFCSEGEKYPTFSWKCKNKRNVASLLYCLLSALMNRTWKSFHMFSIPYSLPLDLKRAIGDGVLPTQLGRVLSGQLIKTFIPSIPNSVHFNLFNSHRKSKIKSVKSHIAAQLQRSQRKKGFTAAWSLCSASQKSLEMLGTPRWKIFTK